MTHRPSWLSWQYWLPALTVHHADELTRGGDGGGGGDGGDGGALADAQTVKPMPVTLVSECHHMVAPP